MDSVSVHLAAYDVLEAALVADSLEAALEPMRLDLEVLAREDLLRVAMALAWETRAILQPAERPRFRERLGRRRLAAMVGPIR